MMHDRRGLSWLAGTASLMLAILGMMLVIAGVLVGGTYTAGVVLLGIAAAGFLAAGLLSGGTDVRHAG